MVTTASGQTAKPAVALAGESAKKPAASNGLLNDWLREQSTSFTPWNLGGEVRVRYELFDDGGPAYPNRDFQRTGVNNDNSYLRMR
jgi:hypothetical protein